VWYHVRGVRDAAWGYPEPKTHVHIKSCVTFVTGKGISVSEDSSGSGSHNSLSSLRATSTSVLDRRSTKAVMPNDGVTSFTRCSGQLKTPESALLRTSSALEAAGTAAAGNGRAASAGAAQLRVPTAITGQHFSAQTNNFPELPQAGSETIWFDSAFCSKALDVVAPNCLRCTSNATRNSQGVCFLGPEVRRGEHASVRIRLDNKPGRMRYFLGLSRHRFAVDGSDAELRRAGWSIENLFSRPHQEGSPCNVKSPPIFHTGSVVSISADLRDPAKAKAIFSVDNTGVEFCVQLPTKKLETVVFWVSLYNRFAQFTILDE